MDERRGLRAGYLAAASGFVSIIMALALLGMAIRNQVIAPPWLHVQLGQWHLVAFTTPVPSEARIVHCQSSAPPCPSGRLYKQYSVWVVDARQLPQHPDSAFWRLVDIDLK